MNDTQQAPDYSKQKEIVIRLMVDNGLTWEDVLLLVKRHLNDLEFEQDLKQVYEPEEWSDWVEGDLV